MIDQRVALYLYGDQSDTSAAYRIFGELITASSDMHPVHGAGRAGGGGGGREASGARGEGRGRVCRFELADDVTQRTARGGAERRGADGFGPVEVR